LELLGDSAPTVVFVTAHDDYAIQAFDANAIDYLLKPVSAERLSQTVTKLVQRLLQQRPQHHLSEPLPSLSHKERRSNLTESLLQKHQHQKAPISRILIRDKADVILVPTTEVMAIAAADDYVVVQSTQGNHIKQERLNNLEALLDPNNFCRIHRSCIINLAFLKAIETEGRENRFALLHNNQQFPISRSGYARLLKLL
jgi:two-component system LytT family response regulator